MLSRHFLRAKALQSLYAAYTANRNYAYAPQELFPGVDFEHDQHPTEPGATFEYNVQRLNDLGILQLSTLPQLVLTAERIQESAMQKFNPTDEEKNPNRKFVNNEFIARLERCREFRAQCERLHIDWSGNGDVFRKVYNTLKGSQQYADYLSDAGQSFEADQAFALIAFKALMNEDTLRDLIYERDLLWEDDYDQVAQYDFMLIKELTPEMDEATPCPLVYDRRKEKDAADYDFAHTLTTETYKHFDEVEPLIRKHLQNWEFERVALIDVLMINMAVTEFCYCPTIPERVTVDEYIELAKEFSTTKSKLFINGILDKILIELRVAGKVEKSGRGLMEKYTEEN